MADAYLALGSNLGDRADRLAYARRELERRAGNILAASSIYDTAPWGPVPQEKYFNQVVRIATELPPRELLMVLHSIEREAGRDRTNEVRYGPRVLDLDILMYDDVCISEVGLTIPHPRLAERAFVLVPLAEIAPAIAVHGTPIRELLGRIDSSTVSRYQPS